MRRKLIALLACCALSAGLGGCGACQTETTHKKPSIQQSQKKTGGETIRSERGNIIKHIGDVAALEKDHENIAQWTLTNITIDAKCTNPEAEAPDHGHFVEFDMKVSTTVKFDSEREGDLTLGDGWMWKYVQKDGTQWNGTPAGDKTLSCMTQEEQLPLRLGKGLKASGKIVFDLPSTDGTLVYAQGGVDGWEYPLN